MPKILVVDNEEHTGFAEYLGRFADVAYYSPWQNAYPLSRMLYPGRGLKNVERVDRPLRYLIENEVDLVCAPHLNHDDLEFAAKSMGIPVFGGGEGCEIEQDRWFLKEFLASHDLPVINSVEIAGIDALQDYLKKPANEDKHIKVSTIRGDMNTFHHRDWIETSDRFVSMRKQLGPIGSQLRWVVEDPIPSVTEVTVEGFFIDGALLEPFMVGMEIKDAGEFGFYCDSIKKLPVGIQKILAALSEYFAKAKYRNFFAVEIRILENGDCYATDMCCRIPVPPGSALTRSTKNLIEIMTKGAQGIAVAVDVGDAKFLTEIELKSPWAIDGFLHVRYPKEFQDNLSLFSHCLIDGENWCLPHVPTDPEMDGFGSAFAFSSDMEECAEECKEAADSVQAIGVHYKSDTLETAREELAKAAKLGIKP